MKSDNLKKLKVENKKNIKVEMKNERNQKHKKLPN